MVRCFILPYILILTTVVQGYTKTRLNKDNYYGYYGHKFRQPMKSYKHFKMAHFPKMSYSSILYPFPVLHIHKPFSISPYTLHKKMLLMKGIKKNRINIFPKLYEKRNFVRTPEPSYNTLVWDSSKSTFVRPGEYQIQPFDEPHQPFGFSFKTGQDNPRDFPSNPMSPDNGNHIQPFNVHVQGNVPRFREGFPNIVEQRGIDLAQNTDNPTNFPVSESIVRGTDINTPTDSSISVPNLDSVTSVTDHSTPLSEFSTSPGSVPSNTSIGIDITPSLGVVDVIPGTGNVEIDTRLPNEGVPISIDLLNSAVSSGLSLPRASGGNLDGTLSDTSIGGTRSVSVTDGIVVGTNLFDFGNTNLAGDVNANLAGDINIIGQRDLLGNVAVPSGLSVVDVNGGRIGIAPDLNRDFALTLVGGHRGLGVDARGISRDLDGDLNVAIVGPGAQTIGVDEIRLRPVLNRDINVVIAGGQGLTGVDGRRRISDLNINQNRGVNVAIFDGQTAIPVGSTENPFLEPMESMGAFGPGPYYTCHPPKRVVCNANSDWLTVVGIEEWCQQNCVVDNYSSYCDDDRCSCKCVDNE